VTASQLHTIRHEVSDSSKRVQQKD